MKSFNKSLAFFVPFVFAAHIVGAQIESHEQNLIEETATVTFECNGCNASNKFLIAGPEKFKFKNVSFPFNQEMKLGDYKMIFWQNGMKLIDLPFQIQRNAENIIKVDEGSTF